MNRRSFIGIGTLALAAGSALFSAGCSVFNKIAAWIGVGIAAVTSVVNLLAGAGILNTVEGGLITTALGLIKAGFADVQAAIAEYENAPADSKLTFAGRISTALQALSDQLQKFWSDLNIPHASLAALVQGLIGIILSTIAGFMTQLPPPATPPLTVSKRLSVVPQKRDEKQFRSDFNALLAQSGQSQYAIK